MKAVKLVTIVMFVLLFVSRTTWAQDADENMVGKEETLSDLPSETFDRLDAEVKPYQGDIGLDDLTINESEETAPLVSNETLSPEAVMDTETLPSTDTAIETIAPDAVVQEEVKNMPDQSVVDAIKADISERRKSSGKLDLFDGETNKVRTLDLIEFKGTAKEDEMEVVQADFRDTTTGDIVTMNIKITNTDGVIAVKDMNIASVAAPAVKEVKTEYTDEEVMKFMREYIETQSQGTGTFDLYDEKAQKMRNLQFVKLNEKLRRYGIIAIAGAEFTDKNTGDIVSVDVNTENKQGLSVTAMRLKSVKKPAPQQ
jgi:hypothetical protein